MSDERRENNLPAQLPKPPKHPTARFWVAIRKDEVLPAILRARFSITDEPNGPLVRFQSMGHIHDEDGFEIVNFLCNECSFGIPSKVIQKLSPTFLRHKVGKFINIWGWSWAVRLDCYSIEVNGSLLEQWQFQWPGLFQR